MWTVVIQAGGLSERMGENKALVPFRGQPLIARVIDRVKQLGDELMIVTREGEDFPLRNIKIVHDFISGYGPLGGLYTAMHFAKNPFVLIVACDMPFLQTDLLRKQQFMLEFGEYDVVVPSLRKGLEPFHAVYRKDICEREIFQAIQTGERRPISWFSKVKCKKMDESEIQLVDQELLSFWNINTKEELEAAVKFSEQKEI